MGWSESERGGFCKWHPTTNRLPGVCSSCLRERLSRLSDSPSNTKTTTFGIGRGYNFSLSPHSSSTSPTYAPARAPTRHHRTASDLKSSIPFFFSVAGAGAGGGGLKKSRSLAFVTSSQHEEGKIGNKKKIGFWSKLLGNTGKRNDNKNKNEVIIKHSKTFRESLHIKV